MVESAVLEQMSAKMTGPVNVNRNAQQEWKNNHAETCAQRKSRLPTLKLAAMMAHRLMSNSPSSMAGCSSRLCRPSRIISLLSSVLLYLCSCLLCYSYPVTPASWSTRRADLIWGIADPRTRALAEDKRCTGERTVGHPGSRCLQESPRIGCAETSRTECAPNP